MDSNEEGCMFEQNLTISSSGVIISKEEPKSNTIDDGQSQEKKVEVDLTEKFTSDTVFISRDELVRWTRDVGKEVGTVVIISKSQNAYKGKSARIYFGCERGGTYRVAKKDYVPKGGDSKRRTGTKRCGCPFSLRGVKMPKDDEWMVKVTCGVHNHKVAEHFEGHSFAGRLSNKEKEIVVDLTCSGVMPRQVLSALKKRDACNASTVITIYNARKRMRLLARAGQTQLQQLLQLLSDNGYVQYNRRNNTNALMDIFLAHPYSIKLAKCFPDVFLMDCKYKTNKYRWPLLQIVGVTSTNMTFSVAFAYMENEIEDHFFWALERLSSVLDTHPLVIVTDRNLALMNAIKRVFPNTRNFLCRFHISKNLATKCKENFENENEWLRFLSEWNSLVCSPTEDEYIARLETFKSEFAAHQALSYVNDNWLSRYKECFVAAWTDRTTHFGCTTTNKVEDAHASLKRYLGSSLSNFLSSWGIIQDVVLSQHSEIKASFEKSTGMVMHEYSTAVYKELRGFVSFAALDLLRIEVKNAESAGIDVNDCNCVIQRTHGLPCGHEIAKYQLEGRPIPLSSIHPHWKKLSDTPNMIIKPELDHRPAFERLLKKILEADDQGKIELIQKINELVSPSITS